VQPESPFENEESIKNLSLSIASHNFNPLLFHSQYLTKMKDKKQKYYFSYFYRIYCKNHYADL